MNKDAEKEIERLLVEERAGHDYDNNIIPAARIREEQIRLRKSMQWAYADSAKVCRTIADTDYDIVSKIPIKTTDARLFTIRGNRCDDCADAIEQRAKEE